MEQEQKVRPGLPQFNRGPAGPGAGTDQTLRPPTPRALMHVDQTVRAKSAASQLNSAEPTRGSPRPETLPDNTRALWGEGQNKKAESKGHSEQHTVTKQLGDGTFTNPSLEETWNFLALECKDP